MDYKVYDLGTVINYNPVTTSLCSNPGSDPNGCLKFYILYEPGSHWEYLDLITAITFNSNKMSYPQALTFKNGLTWDSGPHFPDGEEIAAASGHDSIEDYQIQVPEWLKGNYWTDTDAGEFADGPDGSYIRPLQYAVYNNSIIGTTSDANGSYLGVRLATTISKDKLN